MPPAKKRLPRERKLSARMERLLADIQADYDGAVTRGEKAYARLLNDAMQRVRRGEKP